MKRIYLIRHGQSTANVDNRVYFKTFDHRIGLTEHGQGQALAVGKELAKALNGRPIDVFLSPYRRVNQTWAEIKKALKPSQIKSIEENPNLREQEHKIFADEMEANIKKQDQVKFGIFWYRFKNAESIADVYQRVGGVINHLKLQALGQECEEDIVIVAHEITIRCIMMILQKLSIKQMLKQEVHNCQLIIFEKEEGKKGFTRKQ